MGDIRQISIEPCNATWGDVDLGYLDGDITVTPEESAVEIKAHQTGNVVLDSLRTGNNVTVEMTLKEAAVDKLKAILKVSGDESEGQVEKTTFEFLTAAGINSKYVTLCTALDALKHYVWFDVDNTGVDPAPAGLTAIVVELPAAPTLAQVITAFQAAVDAHAGYTAVEADGIVTVETIVIGHATDATDGDAGEAIVTVEVTQQGTNAMTGVGDSKNNRSRFLDAQKLTLHPVALPASDRSRDLVFWKAYPRINSIVISGENPRTTPLEFTVFLDLTRPAEVRLFAVGDGR